MEALNTISVHIISWTISYLFHGTLIFISLRAISFLKAIASNSLKERLFRFALIGPAFTALLQIWTGWEYSLIDNTGFTMSSTTRIGLETDFHWLSHWPIICMTGWFVVSSLLFFRHRILIRGFIKSVNPLVLPNSKMGKGIELHGDLHRGKNVRYLISTKMVSPFVYNGNTIVLPELAVRKLSANEIRCMLAHELAHIERRDWIWLRVYNIFQLVFFFQPLNWFIKTKLIGISEKICDAKAVQMTGDKKSLAASILEVASWTVFTHKIVLGLAFRPSFMEQRIDSILGSKPIDAPISRWSTSIIFIGLCLPCLVVAPVFSVKNGYDRVVSTGVVPEHPNVDPLTEMGGYGLGAPRSLEKENEVPNTGEINLVVEKEVELNL